VVGLYSAKSVCTEDNIEAISALARLVIFTFSLNFTSVFLFSGIFQIPGSHITPTLKGLKIGTLNPPHPRGAIERKVKLVSGNGGEYALFEGVVVPYAVMYDCFSHLVLGVLGPPFLGE
jgi:hypothetical protein